MTAVEKQTAVGDIVRENELTAGVFFRHGIDFCCGGGISLEKACQKKELSVETVLEEIRATGKPSDNSAIHEDTPLAGIIQHIILEFHQTHREEIPVILYLVEKVLRVHGENHPELAEVYRLTMGIFPELENHMRKEENILFPLIKKLEREEKDPDPGPLMLCGNIHGPLNQMEFEHETVGGDIHALREVTNNFTPPEGACNSYRGLYAHLKKICLDLMVHIHMENNILHPRARLLSGGNPDPRGKE